MQSKIFFLLHLSTAGVVDVDDLSCHPSSIVPSSVHPSERLVYVCTAIGTCANFASVKMNAANKFAISELKSFTKNIVSFGLLKQMGRNRGVFNHVLLPHNMQSLALLIFCTWLPCILSADKTIDSVCLSHIYSRAQALLRGDGRVSYLSWPAESMEHTAGVTQSPSLDRLFPLMTVSYCKGPHFCQQAQLRDQPIII